MGNKSYSKGISWIDDCRIPYVDGDKFDIRRYNEYHDTFSSYEDRGSAEGKYEVIEPNTQGRFPANILVSDDMLNDGVVSKSEGRKIYENEDININNNVYNDGWKRQKSDIKDKGSNSRYYDIDKWFDKILE